MNALRTAWRPVWRFIKRVIRTGVRMAKSRHLPWWLRVLFVIGCVQIPLLPFDEIALVMAVGIAAIFYRPALLAAWANDVTEEA